MYKNPQFLLNILLMSDGPTIICIVLKVFIKIKFSERGRNKKQTNDNEISNGLPPT